MKNEEGKEARDNDYEVNKDVSSNFVNSNLYSLKIFV